MENLADRIARAVSEPIAIVEYDPRWPAMFRHEKAHLQACLPPDLIGRIEHFGSTAVPGLAAKPIVDMLVEVRSLADAKTQAVPVLEEQGYEYFWRPTHGDDSPPFYAWFIKRDAATGARTHHIHMVESSFTSHWDRLVFRDYLIANPDVAREYETVKRQAAKSAANRAEYTQAKTDFIERMTADAKRWASSR